MINYFPPQGKSYGYLQTNRSNFLGSMWASEALDFQSDLGVMRIGSRFQINTLKGDSGAADLGVAVTFDIFDGRVFSIAGTKVYKTTPLSTIDLDDPFTEDTSTGFITNYSSDVSDAVVFNNNLATTDVNSNLYTKASNGTGTGAWTNRGSFTSVAHSLAYFKNFNRLYGGGTSSVNSVDNAWNITTTGEDYNIDLNLVGESVSCIIADDQNVWIGTNINGGSGQNIVQQCTIFQWDGISQQPTATFAIPAAGIMAMTLRNNIVTAMDSNGILRQYAGSYFQEIGRLPLKAGQALGFSTNFGNSSRFMHPRGLQVTENNTILALIVNQNSTIVNGLLTNENLPSGVWEWSDTNGFTHKSALSYTRVGTTTITDFGQNIIDKAGALNLIKIPNFIPFSTLIAGAQYFTNATDTTTAIFVDSPKPPNDTFPDIQKKGYFVTTWFMSNQMEDKWERLWQMHRLFENSTDSIIFKYRLSDIRPVVATITWTSTTTFTTTTDVSGYIGNEVEVLQGTGSSGCSHITSVVNNAGTYTVTVDTAYTGVTTGTAKARFQKWIKLNAVGSPGTIKQWAQMAIGANASLIQIKGCLTWTGDGEFLKMALFSNEDIKINA